MILPEYDVTIRVADPNDPDTYAEATVRRSQRDPLLANPLIGAVVSTLEKMED